ncbi:MAG: ribosomal RNA small subunit methyltransferase A [Candidatus Aureabacteria bacterium]|nr:ribosomal RNA small subunit methyltransferase A [Candidatus Auribacterota bacterium]
MKHSKKSLIHTLNDIDLRPSKSYGQNFLIDENLTNKIIRKCNVSPVDNILEIGPGLGALTYEFLKKGARVTAIEKDPRLFSYLKEHLSGYENFTIHLGDVLKTPFTKNNLPSPPYKIVANIPYNISSQIILKIIMHSHLFPEVYLGMQLEVAMRLAASEGSKTYGLLSPLLQLEYKSKIILSLSPACFHPSPKVTSAFLYIKRAHIFPQKEKENYFQFLKLSFSQRRKMLIKMLKKRYAVDLIIRSFDKLKIQDKARAESISPEKFYKLFKLLEKED